MFFSNDCLPNGPDGARFQLLDRLPSSTVDYSSFRVRFCRAAS